MVKRAWAQAAVRQTGVEPACTPVANLLSPSQVAELGVQTYRYTDRSITGLPIAVSIPSIADRINHALLNTLRDPTDRTRTRTRRSNPSSAHAALPAQVKGVEDKQRCVYIYIAEVSCLVVQRVRQ